MSAKQDRVAPRTASDIERKYNFGQTFAEFAGLVGDAQKAANDAEAAAKEATKAVANLDQEEIFNRLTNNGEVQGVFRAEDGQIYINASYLVTGILSSMDKSVAFNLDKGILYSSGEFAEKKVEFRLTSSGIACRASSIDDPMDYTDIFEISVVAIDGKLQVLITDGSVNPTYPGFILNGRGGLNIGSTYGDVVVEGKKISWKDNGDGTHTLIGTD